MDGCCGRLHVEDVRKRMIRERVLVKSERLDGGQTRQ